MFRNYRFTSIPDIPNSFFKSNSILRGTIIRVGDADGCRFIHEPLFYRIWTKQVIKQDSLSIRLAGIDAPELGHFGNPQQPLSVEAKQWLTKYLLNERVKIVLLRRDQYDRIIAMVYVRKGFFRTYKNVSLEMLRLGLACVYTGAGSEYYGLQREFQKEQEAAKFWKRGIWGLKDYKSPMDYKKELKK